MDELIALVLSTLVLPVTYCIGAINEKSHLNSLKVREAALKDVLVTTLEDPVVAGNAELPPKLVAGEVVVSSDHFKTWLFGWRNFFGGESRTFSKLFERAQREAVLRMVEEARREGYDAICNVRFGSVDIVGNAATNGQTKTLKVATCFVTGTAYRRA